jgi:hypothetical protein
LALDEPSDQALHFLRTHFSRATVLSDGTLRFASTRARAKFFQRMQQWRIHVGHLRHETVYTERQQAAFFRRP